MALLVSVNVGLPREVAWRGKTFDVVTPPEYHHGTRATQHWTLGMRKRPNG